MKARKIFEVLLYLALLLGGFVFVWNSILDYMSGITTFSVEHELLSLSDLPTITFCFENDFPLDWKQHFKLDVSVEDGKKSKRYKLTENESIETLFGLEMRLNEFKQTSSIEFAYLSQSLYLACYKFSSKFVSGESVNDHKNLSLSKK